MNFRVYNRAAGVKPEDTYGDKKCFENPLPSNYNVDFMAPWLSDIETKANSAPTHGKIDMLRATLRTLRYFFEIGLRTTPYVKRASGVPLRKLLNSMDILSGEGYKSYESSLHIEESTVSDTSDSFNIVVSTIEDDDDEYATTATTGMEGYLLFLMLLLLLLLLEWKVIYYF